MSLIFRVTALVTLFVFMLTSVAYSQTSAEIIDTLAIDVWPDYDRTAVLVLMTGTLPEDTPLPTAVTIPLPSEADLNVVARITEDNNMIDDVDFTLQDEAVQFVIPDRRFRVEYYLPYDEDGLERQFDFSWLADISVNQLEVAVQEPKSAVELNTEPATTNVGVDSADGMVYHILPAVPVPAGISYDFSVNYTLESPTLSANQPQAAPLQTIPPPADESGFDWPLLLAGLGIGLILAAVVWQVAANRNKRKRPSKTARRKPAKAAKPAKSVKFCHQCGAALKPGDKFCAECGTAVKQK